MIADHLDTNTTLSRSRLILLVLIATVIVVVIAALMVVPLWLSVLIPRWFVRGLTVAVLWSVFAAFVAGLFVAPVLTCVFMGMIRQSRRCGRPWLPLARGLMLGVSLFLGALILESGAAAGRAWVHRLPILPTHFAKTHDEAQAIRIVVVGESSARGEPYNPWLSVAQIIARPLGEILGKRVDVDIKAYGGINLEQAIDRFKTIDERPDAVLVFCGHNEFQSRFGWDREVVHYRDRQPRRPPHQALLETMARWSSLAHLVDESLERHQLDIAPPRKVTRSLIDVPCCSPDESRAIRVDFRRRLEHLVKYCETIGALPILIAPVSNDADYEPNRSIMAPDVPAAARATFARDFESARALESTDPAAALAAFRSLLRREPGFAETHFRLARLLERAGLWDEARLHDTKARDLDAMPTRCPSDFHQIYRDIASRHNAVLIDGPAVLSAVSKRHGLVGDNLLNDAHHPNLKGYVALSQELLKHLHARNAFGWPEGRKPPTLHPAEVAQVFGMDAAKWSIVCSRSANFYDGAAYIRYDPVDRLRHARHYTAAIKQLTAGETIGETGLPGLDDAE